MTTTTPAPPPGDTPDQGRSRGETGSGSGASGSAAALVRVEDAAGMVNRFVAERYRAVADLMIASRRDARAVETVTSPRDSEQRRGVLRARELRRESSGVEFENLADRSTRLELAAALRVTEYAAGELMRHAQTLVIDHPNIHEALLGSVITDKHAILLSDAVLRVPAGHPRTLLVERALERAAVEGTGQFRRTLQRLTQELHPQTLTEQHTDAVTRRRVVIEPQTDGMTWLSALIPSVEARAIHNRLTAIATRAGENPNDTRTRDQLRADTLCDLLIDGDTTGRDPSDQGIRATVTITVPALTLLEGQHAGLGREGTRLCGDHEHRGSRFAGDPHGDRVWHPRSRHHSPQPDGRRHDSRNLPRTRPHDDCPRPRRNPRVRDRRGRRSDPHLPCD